ncbi:MAG: 4'-phosphopantetheinyl transferase superfamily protein, partial [Acidobacteriia bacterium]|nr:4'-phosphopantetheinyl transferase superfamily protein [Terriglobia bacterium]
MRVFWLEQTEADVPPSNDWLGPAELDRCNAFRFAKRRNDWRLGRWTAKCALAAYLDYPWELARIGIQPAASGAPEAFLAGRPAPATISLSHRAGAAICAVAPAGVALGCDLEAVEPRSDRFLADYFTEREQLLAASVSGEDRDWLVALLWSAKESALKALGTG